MRKLLRATIISLLILGCKIEDKKSEPVPGCDSNGGGAANNPHCQPSQPFIDGLMLYPASGSDPYLFGERLAAGDFNCDGKSDLAVLSYRKFQIYSGSNGQSYYSYDAGSLGASSEFGRGGQGSFKNIGDFDEDGCDDLAVTDYEKNKFYIFSADSSSPIATYHRIDDRLYDAVGQEGRGFGYSLDGGHDINSDGVMDFVVGAPYHDSITAMGATYLISGADGSTISKLEITHPCNGSGCPGFFGISVAFGQFNASADLDVAVGDGCYLTAGGWCAGAVFTFSTANFSQTNLMGGQRLSEQFGYSIENVGDINNDGIDELSVSAIRGSGGGSSGWDYARVYLVDWTTAFPQLYRQSTQYMDNFGQRMTSAGDFNGDGTLDILVEKPLQTLSGVYDSGATRIGKIEVLSGADLSVLYSEVGTIESPLMAGLAGLGDVNNDGKDDIAFTAPGKFVKLIFGR